MEHEHLTRPTKYNIEDTNIALLGSDLEKRVREHAGDKELAWDQAGLAPGLQIWRIEKFQVVEWPKERYGSFYNGDSYIVLHTYKKNKDTDALSYDLHFWLGEETSQDEAGTAAYKTVELDDHLAGAPVQYREVQGYESPHFLSYFPRFVCLHGGVSTGFHHVQAPPPSNIKKLYRVNVFHLPRPKSGSHLLVRQVSFPVGADALAGGDVFVLDEGDKIWQFNALRSVGRERFKAAEFAQWLVSERQGRPEVTVFDEGTPGAGIFLSTLGVESLPPTSSKQSPQATSPKLYRLSDSSGQVTFTSVSPPFSLSSLSSDEAFLLDNANALGSASAHPGIYVWIGRNASLNERRLAVQYAQRYLYEKGLGGAVSIVKMNEGRESDAFLMAIGGLA